MSSIHSDQPVFVRSIGKGSTAQREAMDPNFLYVDSEDTEQTVWVRYQIGVFAGSKDQIVSFVTQRLN